jgi:hypothetical protein
LRERNPNFLGGDPPPAERGSDFPEVQVAKALTPSQVPRKAPEKMGNLERKGLAVRYLRADNSRQLTRFCHSVNCRTYYGL